MPRICRCGLAQVRLQCPSRSQNDAVAGGCVASRTAKVSGQWVLPIATGMNLRQDLPSSESPADMMLEGTTLKRQWMVADGVVKCRIGRY
jgi:hypothetical protein